MKVEQRTWRADQGWERVSEDKFEGKASLVLVFGTSKTIGNDSLIKEISNTYPGVDVIYCSSETSFIGTRIENQGLSLTALYFEKTDVQIVQIDASTVKDSFDAGAHISAMLDKDNLKGVILLSGTIPAINTSHLLTGMHFNLSDHIPIIGGAACDRINAVPKVGVNQQGSPTTIVAIGLSGDHILFGHGVDDAWMPFGTERFVTKSENNIVYRLDDMTPYDLYQKYLEGLVDDIPGSLANYPLGLKLDTSDRRLVRGVLSVDVESGAVVFAGDVPEGSKIRMMKSNVSRLIDASSYAAKRSKQPFDINVPDFAFIFDCKNRQNILEDWDEEEIEAIVSSLGTNVPTMGLYSSGEYAPMKPGHKTVLQNQAVAIATFKEIE